MSENSLANMILKSAGIYSDEQLQRISENRAANPGMGLAEAAVKFGGAKEIEFLSAVGKSLGLETVDLERQQPNPDALTKLPASAVYQYNVLPFKTDGTSLTIVTSDPFDTSAADGLRLVAGCPIKTALAPKEEVENAVKKYYGVGADAIEKMIEDGRYSVDEDIGAMTKIDVNEMGEEASIVRFVNQIIAEADRQGERVHAVRLHRPPVPGQHVRTQDHAREAARHEPVPHPQPVPPDLVAEHDVPGLRQPQPPHLPADGGQQLVGLPHAAEGVPARLAPRKERGVP